MSAALPLVTRREIVREYRPDENVTLDSGVRALRAKSALSEGLSVRPRGGTGEFGGRLQLYSVLNRDAARAVRRGDVPTAQRICVAAAAVERSSVAQELVIALSGAVVTSTAGLARVLSAPRLSRLVAALNEDVEGARRDLRLDVGNTVLSGHVATIGDSVAVLKLRGSIDFPVPRPMLEAAELDRVGAPVSASWELLPGGRTLLTVEPAVDVPETNELGEPLADMYGTPWGSVLIDEDALRPTGTPTVEIPAGIPDVE
jgi:hypothetical protein